VVSLQARLEIIGPQGEIRFYDLDPERGVTNIGRHPDNDLVLDDPRIALFHAVLDHRQPPYQIINLDGENEMMLGQQPLPPNTATEIRTWDTLQLGGYTLILQESEPVPSQAERPAAPPVSPAAPAAPAPLPVAPPTGMAVLPSDQTDSVVMASLSEREWTVDVEQTVSLEVSIVNGGGLVASFDIQVEGLDPAWVTILTPSVNLHEGARTTVTIFISPPRRPSSTAGPHPFSVVVTSPEYPGRQSRLYALLHINPYYEFSVGELSPKRQNVSYRKRSGQAQITITNKGNSNALFRLQGEDAEKGCNFEFLVPGEEIGGGRATEQEVAWANQAEVRVAAGTTIFVSFLITPLTRRLVSLRRHTYNYTITTTLVDGGLAPRALLGELKMGPLIGPWMLLMMLIGLALLVGFFFRPAAEPTLQADTTTPLVNQEITLTYDASRFPGLSPSGVFNHLNALFLRLTLEYRTEGGQWQTLKAPSELTAPTGAVVHTPTENGYYRLRAENWLSRLVPWLAGRSKEVAVYVTPVKPFIVEFRADRSQVWVGEEVTLFWRVADADTVKIEYDGIEETFEGEELQSGQRSYTIEQDTVFTLSAGNNSWPEEVQKPLRIMALARPVPTPVIIRFDVDPLEITVGETVRIDWEVEGADTVSIDPLGTGLPVKGNMGDQPTSLTTYQLTAYKTGEDGTTVENKSLLREVVVNPLPTPSPVPQAPQIQLFQATPNEIVGGQGEQVKLTWSVSGAFTKIDITNPNLVFSTPISRSGTITVTPKETTLYVLTAYNGDLSSSMPAEVTVLEPTPTPTMTPVPTVPPTPTPTPTPFPPPFISFYKAEGLDPTQDRVVFKGATETDNGTVYLYEVEVGARVKLSWSVENAEKVTIQNLGAQPTSGEVVLPDPVTAAASYMLTAENNGGANQVSAFVQFEVTAMQPPPPPYGVRGVEDVAAGTNRIEWNYDDQYRGVIIGFRIYRADVPPGDSFLPVGMVDDPNATSWTDTALNETCGKAYYVVAVYIDPVRNEERETEASTTSWYSRPCP